MWNILVSTCCVCEYVATLRFLDVSGSKSRNKMLNKIRLLDPYWIFATSHYFNDKNVICVFFVLNCRWGKKTKPNRSITLLVVQPLLVPRLCGSSLSIFGCYLWARKASGLLISHTRWSLILCSGLEREWRFWSPKCWSILCPCLITWILPHSLSQNPVTGLSWSGNPSFPCYCFPGDRPSAQWLPWPQLPVCPIPKPCPLDSFLLLLLVCTGPSIHAPN